jgi:hypothetical protein
MNIVKRYIPEKVLGKINGLEYKNREHLYIVCDMIYRSSIFKKENKDYSNVFVDIPKFYFRDLIQDSKSLSDCMSFLKDNSIIECDGISSKESGKALGYRFKDEYLSKLVSVNITKKSLSKRIIVNRNERNNYVNMSYHRYRDYYLNTFKIDYNKSIEYLNEWYQHSLSLLNSLLCGRNLNPSYIKVLNKYNNIFMALSAINDGDLYFRKNTTNGRIDTNLTSLKSEYKKFIVTDKPLYQIDIVNSQPFILSIHLLNTLLCGRNLNDDLRSELGKYEKWTTDGIFYEMFEREYFSKTSKTLSRKEIKDMMFCIFYSKNDSYRKEKSIFISVFPNIYRWIEKQKETKYNEFAIKLQKIESDICIEKVCKELDSNNIYYYTIHDAWLVKEEDIEKTKKIVETTFNDVLSRIPKLKIEKVN